MRRKSAEDALMSRVVGRGSRKGSTLIGRTSDVVARPPTWGALATLLDHRSGRPPGGAAGERLLPHGSRVASSDQGCGREEASPGGGAPAARAFHLLVSVGPFGRRVGLRTWSLAGDPASASAALRRHVGSRRLKSRLRPMRGLKSTTGAQLISSGHAFVQNLRRGHYELAVEVPPRRRLAHAFAELALVI